MFYVYGLKVKGDSEYRYIGCTSEPDVRLLAHLSYDRKNMPKYEWVKSHKGNIEMVVLAEYEDGFDAAIKEANQIAKYRRAGHRLFNKMGRGFTRATSNETKTKLSKPKKRRMTKEQKDAILKEWMKD